MGSYVSIRRAPHRLRSAILLATSGALALLLAETAPAHHSGALWDSSKTVSLEGTVKEFQWSNPHCWIQLLVTNAGAAANDAQEWSIEMAAPIQMLQGGWKPRTSKAGDRIRPPRPNPPRG